MTAPLQTRVGDLEESGTGVYVNPVVHDFPVWPIENHLIHDKPMVAYLVYQEIFSHHGVVVLKNSNREDDSHCNGTLSIVQYSYGKSIEWKPADVSVVSDCQEQEWAIVNTVGRRSRTLSESGDIMTWRHAIQIPICNLKSYNVHKRSRQLMLMQRDGICHNTFFQFGNADTFVHALRAIIKTRRSRRDKHRYIVIGERAESASLNRSFAELNLFNENPTDVVWKFVSNLKHRPYETTMQTFSKLSDALLYRGLEEQRPLDETDVAELLNRSLNSTVDVGAEVEGDYQVVGVLPPRSPAPRGSPITIEQWSNAMDPLGRVVDASVIKEQIFRGGVSPSLRNEVWKFLLGYYPWNSTTAERQAIRKLKVEEYFQMKLQWRSVTPRQEERFSSFRERKCLVEKDVNRTDRTIPFFAGDNNPNLVLLSDILMTYVMYNFDLGYVQGMSDLLSPILTLMSNEVDAFWCFVGFMDRVCSNFDMDQAGMKKQLSQLYSLLSSADHVLGSYLEAHESANMFFCFRWLLVLFKREFSHQQIMNLWEVLWTDLPCPNFHLLICVAILDTEKTILIENNYGFTEILKHVNDLSLRMDLQMLLSKAESIYRQLADSQQLSEATKRVIGLAPDRSGSTSSSEDESIDPDKLSDHEFFEPISYSPTSPDEDDFETSINFNYN